jgi:ferrous iron transport protein B
MPHLTIALAGNPNAGKSTIFNALTGLRQHVGNWPGKTVEKREGVCRHHGLSINVVDLPGTYSLTAYSPDEVIARDFIIYDKPDLVISVVDATNLERNLYLVVQIMELGVPLVLALNMSDQLQRQGLQLDLGRLSHLLGGVPVVATAANREQGIDQLLTVAAQFAGSSASDNGHCLNGGANSETGQSYHNGSCPKCGPVPAFRIDYGKELESDIERVAAAVQQLNAKALAHYQPRWLALKLLENEEDVVARVCRTAGGEELVQLARERALERRNFFGEDLDLITAGHRYGYINGLSRQIVRRSDTGRISLTGRIDDAVTHRLFGLPIFMAVMYVIFRLVIDVSAPFLEWTEGVITGPVSRWLGLLLAAVSAPEWLHALVIDGALAGVGAVLVFVPGLIALYFFLALLEDTGYMARAAFVMDRFMRLVGLHGKSVIPLLLGFGCAVPAVYATRTMPYWRDRLLTALLVPLMSCSARLPVYVVFGLAFFGARAGTVIWMLYLLGIVVAMLAALVFSRTILKPQGDSTFVLELPPYRLPTLKSLFIHTWENTREFIQRAGTVILAGTIVLWFLLHLPWGVAEQRHSYFGRVSVAVTPLFQPLGFGEWEATGALVTGFIAKELVVSTMAQIYVGAAAADAADTAAAATATAGQEMAEILTGFVNANVNAGRTLLSILPGVDLLPEEGIAEDMRLSTALRNQYSPLAAFTFLVFVLLYVPCVATLGAIRQEFGWRWAATAGLYQTVVAWVVALAVYQGGRWLGLG